MRLIYARMSTLTAPGDVVLDPMMGSGTTVLEALLAGRYGLGVDIDPLAVMISQAKVSSIDATEALRIGNEILERATETVEKRPHNLALGGFHP